MACSSPQVPIEQLPLSAVVQMLQHKEDTHQDFTLTLIQPAASLLRLPDTDALLDSASVALVTARTSASVALEKTRSSLGALDGLGFSGTRGGSGGDSEPVPQAGAIAAGATESGAWAQVSLDGPSRLGSLSDGSDTTGLMRGPPPIAAASTSSVPVDYSAYYSSSATSMVQQTAATAAAPAPSPPVDYSAYYSSSATSMVQQTGVAVAASDAEPSTFSTESLDGAHDADISAGLDSMFSSRYGGGVGDEVDDVPISRGFMKSGYDVGEQITILSRRNLWRQCYVKQKRPGQLLVCCCAEDGPGLGVDDEREEWISQASKRIRDYWDGTYLQEPSALAIGSGTAHGAVAGTLSQRGDPHAVVSAPSTPQQDDLLGIFVTAPVAAPAPSGLGL